MRKVLIVMEEGSLRNGLITELQTGWDILACGDAAEGAKLMLHRPEALILDLFLPGVDGLTFLRENRHSLPPAVIVLTAFVSSALLDELAALRITAVVRTPCTVSTVVSQLKVPI